MLSLITYALQTTTLLEFFCRTPLLEIILDELTYNEDILPPFLQVVAFYIFTLTCKLTCFGASDYNYSHLFLYVRTCRSSMNLNGSLK